MQSYKIYASNQLVEIKKLDTDEYEFSAVRDHIDYFGKSYLKGLAFITDFKNYLEASDKQIEFLPHNKCIMVRLPLPFSDKFELVELKEVESDEFKKLSIMIKRTTEHFEKEINSLKIELKQSNDYIKDLENNLHKAQKKYYFMGIIFHPSMHATNKEHLEMILKTADEERLRKNPERHRPEIQLNLLDKLNIMSKLGFKVCSNSRLDEIYYSNGTSHKGTLEYVEGKKWNGVVELGNDNEICASRRDRFSEGIELVNIRICGHKYGPDGTIFRYVYY